MAGTRAPGRDRAPRGRPAAAEAFLRESREALEAHGRRPSWRRAAQLADVLVDQGRLDEADRADATRGAASMAERRCSPRSAGARPRAPARAARQPARGRGARARGARLLAATDALSKRAKALLDLATSCRCAGRAGARGRPLSSRRRRLYRRKGNRRRRGLRARPHRRGPKRAESPSPGLSLLVARVGSAPRAAAAAAFDRHHSCCMGHLLSVPHARREPQPAGHGRPTGG